MRDAVQTGDHGSGRVARQYRQRAFVPRAEARGDLRAEYYADLRRLARIDELEFNHVERGLPRVVAGHDSCPS